MAPSAITSGLHAGPEIIYFAVDRVPALGPNAGWFHPPGFARIDPEEIGIHATTIVQARGEACDGSVCVVPDIQTSQIPKKASTEARMESLINLHLKKIFQSSIESSIGSA